MKSKKELQGEYREMKTPTGVFQIRNTTNNKIFIDGSLNMNSKWNRHRMELRFGSHRNEALQKDWKISGEEGFVFEVLSEIDQNKEAGYNYDTDVKELLDSYLQKLMPYDEKGYNRKPKA